MTALSSAKPKEASYIPVDLGDQAGGIFPPLLVMFFSALATFVTMACLIRPNGWVSWTGCFLIAEVIALLSVGLYAIKRYRGMTAALGQHRSVKVLDAMALLASAAGVLLFSILHAVPSLSQYQIAWFNGGVTACAGATVFFLYRVIR